MGFVGRVKGEDMPGDGVCSRKAAILQASKIAKPFLIIVSKTWLNQLKHSRVLSYEDFINSKISKILKCSWEISCIPCFLTGSLRMKFVMFRVSSRCSWVVTVHISSSIV